MQNIVSNQVIIVVILSIKCCNVEIEVLYWTDTITDIYVALYFTLCCFLEFQFTRADFEVFSYLTDMTCSDVFVC